MTQRIRAFGNSFFDVSRITYVSQLTAIVNPHDPNCHKITCSVALDTLTTPIHMVLGFVYTASILDAVEETPEYQKFEQLRLDFVKTWLEHEPR